MKLYAFHLSGNSRKALMALEETGLDYELVSVDLMSRAQKQPEYLALNPNGVVPTLVDGEVVLWESSAIALYVAGKAPEKNLIPGDAFDRARMYQWLVWQPGTFNPPFTRLNMQLRNPDETARDQAVIEEATRAIAANVEILSNALGERDYLVGNFSLADVVMTPHLNALAGMAWELPENLATYTARLVARPSWQAVLSRAG